MSLFGNVGGRFLTTVSISNLRDSMLYFWLIFIGEALPSIESTREKACREVLGLITVCGLTLVVVPEVL